MRLIGEINRGASDAVFKQRMPRRDQRGQIRHRTTTDEQTACRRWQSANATQPANHSELQGRSSRSAEPRPVENIKSGRERIRHRANEIVWARNERKKARMIDMQIIWKQIAFELLEEFVRITAGFRWLALEQGNDQCAIRLSPDRCVLHVGK